MITRRSLFGFALAPLAGTLHNMQIAPTAAQTAPRLAELMNLRDGGPSWASVEAIRALDRALINSSRLDYEIAG